MQEEGLKVVMVLLGGGLGALSRYGISSLAARLLGSGFVWGTMIVNLVGCFLIGLSFALANRTNLMGPVPRLFFVTGFLGALTTFSTFSYECASLLRSELYILAFCNVLINNIIGLAMVFLGMWAGKFI